ncbi:MAG TPA: 50S ribosomal protein L17 [Spirochaetota bacterium]|nr:50S ribosomal protein L17 [Spirochaetota bacterium]HPQ51771.1 50S ribosomal protein L17 [Spirochaetota bacterium]
MRHKSGVKQLGRTHSHRKAMFANMATSLFENERIVTTKQKAKELKKISERLITRAKRNLDIPEEEVGKRLHNKRIVMKTINNRDIIRKLFDDIAPRFKGRNGGYTRIYLLGNRRAGDAAEMAMIELVERRVPEKSAPVDSEKKEKKKLFQKDKKEK